jgi:hypothetical protein
MIGREWGCTGTSLAPPTTSLQFLSSVLAALRNGPSPRTPQRSKAQVDFSSPRSVLSPPMRLPTCLPTICCCCCWAWRQGVLWRRCLAGNMIWLYGLNLSVLPSQCSRLTRTCYLHSGRRWLSSQAVQHQELPIAELPFPSPAKFPHLPELPLSAEHTLGQATFFKHQLCECAPQGTAQSQ